MMFAKNSLIKISIPYKTTSKLWEIIVTNNLHLFFGGGWGGCYSISLRNKIFECVTTSRTAPIVWGGRIKEAYCISEWNHNLGCHPTVGGSSGIHHGNHILHHHLHQIQHYRKHMGSQPSLASSDAHRYLYQPAKLRLKLQWCLNR